MRVDGCEITVKHLGVSMCSSLTIERESRYPAEEQPLGSQRTVSTHRLGLGLTFPLNTLCDLIKSSNNSDMIEGVENFHEEEKSGIVGFSTPGRNLLVYIHSNFCCRSVRLLIIYKVHIFGGNQIIPLTA